MINVCLILIHQLIKLKENQIQNRFLADNQIGSNEDFGLKVKIKKSLFCFHLPFPIGSRQKLMGYLSLRYGL